LRRFIAWCRSNRLAVEIAVIIMLKSVVLSLIWWMWFAEPTARNMRVEPVVIEHRILDDDRHYTR